MQGALNDRVPRNEADEEAGRGAPGGFPLRFVGLLRILIWSIHPAQQQLFPKRKAARRRPLVRLVTAYQATRNAAPDLRR